MSNYLSKNPIISGMLILLMAGGILYLFRQVFLVLFILFGGVLFAIFLIALADFIKRATRIPRTWSLVLVVITLVGTLGSCVWLMGSALGTQVTRLLNRFPEALEIIESYLARYGWGREMLSLVPSPQELFPLGRGLLGNITGVFTSTAGAIAGLFLIFFLGVYLAFEPDTYLDGFLKLFSSDKRGRIREVMHLIGGALRWWLIGRAVAMALVGFLTVLFLWIIGLPLALTLGLIVGLLTFVPFIGPVLAAIPALLVALVEGPYMVVYVLIIYVGLQQLENNILTPLIQKKAIFLPPAVLLSAEILIGVLFGFMGILFASPLLIIFVILVQTLYIQDVLDEPVKILGAHNSPKHPQE